jgi:hypothetical protein
VERKYLERLNHNRKLYLFSWFIFLNFFFFEVARGIHISRAEFLPKILNKFLMMCGQVYYSQIYTRRDFSEYLDTFIYCMLNN